MKIHDNELFSRFCRRMGPGCIPRSFATGHLHHIHVQHHRLRLIQDMTGLLTSRKLGENDEREILSQR